MSSDALKVCTKCMESKPLFDFGKHKASKDGIRPVCKPCNRLASAQFRASNPEYMTQWRRDNQERVNANKSDWAKRNRAAETKRQNAWRSANRDRVRRSARARWSANREKFNEYYREYRKQFEAAHPGLMRSWVQEYRQIKSKACPPWADLKKIEWFYECAAKWNAENPNNRVEVDHFIPLRGKNVCGLHVHSNLQIINWLDNRSKGNKFDGDAYVPNQS